MSEDSEKSASSGKRYTGAGIGVGTAVGVALGVAFGQLALGLALGVAFGSALDVVSHARHKSISKPR